MLKTNVNVQFVESLPQESHENSWDDEDDSVKQSLSKKQINT
jgi:hypothetical protein